MADVVTRFKLETTQFDSKLRDASKSLADISREASKAGKGFADFTKDSVEAARALGQTETSATNAKDKLKELVNAFNTAANAYNNLTEEQKKNDWGKALSESLDTLKGRIAEAKNELQNVGNTMRETSSEGSGLGGILGNLAEKFGVNISQLGAMGVALGAATVATKVATDAFFANEENLDEWGRTVAASESLYRGFLDALNTGDISGYLSRISTIVQAAREAYDALDELATYNAFNQINVEKSRHHLSESINDFREGTGSKENVKTAGDEAINQLIEKQKLQRNAYEKAVNELARTKGVNPKDLYDVFTGSYGDYKELKSLGLSGRSKKLVTGGFTNYSNTGSQYVTVKVAANRREQLGAALRRINDEGELDKIQALGAAAERTNSEIDSVRRQVIRTMNANPGGGGGRGGGSRGGRVGGGGGRGGGGGTHRETPEEKAAKLVASAEETYANAVQTATMRFEAGMDNSETQQKKLLAAQERLAMAYADAYNITKSDEYKTKFGEEAGKFNEMEDVVKGKRDLFNTSTQELAGMSISPMGDILKGLLGEDMQTYAKRKGIDLSTDEGKQKMPRGWVGGEKVASTLGQLSGGMSDVVSGVEALGIDVPEGIEKMITTMQAVQSILTGISTIVMVIQMLTMKNSIPIIGHMANGGIVPHAEGGYYVPGTHYSGDVTPIMANAGEVVLNRAQVGNLASQLQGMGNVHLEAVIEGEDIRLALQNGDRRRGRGEYVTTKSR